MYEMSIVTHYYSVIGILIVIVMNFFMLYRASNIPSYQRQMSLFTPLGSLALGSVIFTGTIMMAAKHLDFTLENIVMILFAFFMIVSEVKRVKNLKYLRSGLEQYKKYARNILLLEAFLTLGISAWMLS
ncbi:MAG: hypothetical protein COB42_07050 [Sulfurimonas sp.]|nr:MAG: hypothetical protein COB42_07050 [Sulfurimonas sp.]